MSENNAGIRQSLGHIALIEQNPELAVDYFLQARLLAPDDEGIAENLIHAQIQAGDWSDVEKSISRLLKKPGNESREDLLVLHAKALMNTGRAVEARTIYQDITSQDEGRSDVESWIGLANASMMIGDLRTVRKAATRVISLDPNSHEGFMLYAMFHRESGDHRSALKSILTAIEKNPSDPVLYALCGLIQRDLGMPNKALASITHASELDPSNAQYARMRTEFTRGATFASSPSTTE
jgi:Flp pilus assembly protein TadD